MDNVFIVTKMQGYIHRAAQELSAWLSDLLPKTCLLYTSPSPRD